MKRAVSRILLLLLIVLAGCAHPAKEGGTLFQNSTFNALLEGVYEGRMTVGELKKHGDFGIGTFDGLDGEMVVIDGRVHRVRADGTVSGIADDTTTPFAAVTFFQAERTETLVGIADFSELEKALNRLIPTKNIYYAFRIEGTFAVVKTRAPHAQHPPYPRLVDALKNQAIFEFTNVRGTIVGFYMPPYIQGINVPGYHFHFLREDRKGGGHLFGCRIENAVIAMGTIKRLSLVLPEGKGFLASDLSQIKEEETKRAEQGGR